jgi:hypothetical protein
MANKNSTLRSLNRLTVKAIDAATLNGRKVRKLSDGGGLILVIRDNASGISKLWQFRYKDLLTGKEQTSSLGPYPDTSLSDRCALTGPVNAHRSCTRQESTMVAAAS